MIDFIFWYLSISIIGLIALPITLNLFPSLSGRGYAFSRILGLLIWGYIFWLLASLGLLGNNIGGLLFGLVVLLGISYLAYRKFSTQELKNWWRENRRLVIWVEIIFLIAFAGWAVVRAANPEILGTEKPMELGFINAILSSPVFPPHDPWLSGYSISYYFFGYVMTAMLAKITATPGSIAFNLALSLVFALSAVASFGIVHSLITAVKTKNDGTSEVSSANNLILSLLGPVFILIVSNFEGFLEVLHARGIFWKFDDPSRPISGFWRWLDLKELTLPPAEPLSWVPSRYLWWWRASRVVQDYDLSGVNREIIDEFPFFSYLLGDLHPHVLVMPFALLSIALLLNIFFGGGKGNYRWLGIHLSINPSIFWLSSLIIGGLAFLNTWDFPMYLIFFGIVYVIHRLNVQRTNSNNSETEFIDQGEQPLPAYTYPDMLKDFLRISVSIGFTGVILYLPWYLSFSSQAGGILPNLIYPTRGAHLWIMFGPLFIPIFVYLIFLWRSDPARFRILQGFLFVVGMIGFLWLASSLFSIGISNLERWGDIFLNSLSWSQGTSLLGESLRRRISMMGWLTILFLLGMVFSYFLALFKKEGDWKNADNIHHDPGLIENTTNIQRTQKSSRDFTVILILMGSLLVLFTDFFYLLDQFGYRINTVFKFFFQTWIFWGIAAAFATAFLLKELRRVWAIIFRIGMVFVFLTAFTYPLFGIWNKTNGFNSSAGFSLDGTKYLGSRNPDEAAGIEWLKSAPAGIVLEAVGGSYSEYARVATLSGQQNVLGWPGHERQWRGGGEEIGTREEDVEMIYRTNNWEDAKMLLDTYDIRYIYIGPLERLTYNVNETKFQRNLGRPVFSSGEVTIYEIPYAEPITGVY